MTISSAAARLGWTVGCVVALAPAADAQQPSSAAWDLVGSFGGYCVSYLADSADVHKLVPRNVVVTPAGNGSGLSGLLARTVQDEPRFASWVPAWFCVHFYREVRRDGKVIAMSRPGHPVILATNAVAAQEPQGVAGATTYLIDFMSDNGEVIKAGQDVGFDMDKISVTTRPGAESGDSEVAINAAGVQMAWTGHPAGDSGVGRTHSMSFGYAGARTVKWLIRLDENPAMTRYMVGTLQITGKNALAAALKASPVRDIGPEESGGSATLTFQVVTKH